jgi:hypothetical protein
VKKRKTEVYKGVSIYEYVVSVYYVESFVCLHMYDENIYFLERIRDGTSSEKDQSYRDSSPSGILSNRSTSSLKETVDLLFTGWPLVAETAVLI